jgi:hypothetical protein
MSFYYRQARVRETSAHLKSVSPVLLFGRKRGAQIEAQNLEFLIALGLATYLFFLGFGSGGWRREICCVSGYADVDELTGVF